MPEHLCSLGQAWNLHTKRLKKLQDPVEDEQDSGIKATLTLARITTTEYSILDGLVMSLQCSKAGKDSINKTTGLLEMAKIESTQ